MDLTQQRLREVLRYDPLTGVFCWRVTRSPNARAGSIAGCINAQGYVKISIDRRIHSAHRLAWLYTHGVWPAGDIDHKDAVRSNNSIANLRPATDSENGANARRPSDNTSGFKGVCWNGQHKRWVARIKAHGRRVHIGYFDNPAIAHKAYVAKAVELFGDFARAA